MPPAVLSGGGIGIKEGILFLKMINRRTCQKRDIVHDSRHPTYCLRSGIIRCRLVRVVA